MSLVLQDAAFKAKSATFVALPSAYAVDILNCHLYLYIVPSHQPCWRCVDEVEFLSIYLSILVHVVRKMHLK